jgi:hypothetical protein
MGANDLSPQNASQGPAALLASLEALTATTALTNGVATTVASWKVDDYGTRVLELALTKTDGSRLRRTVRVNHNGTSGADATTVAVESDGVGTHADLPSTAIDAVLSGVGTAQVINLQVTAAAINWSASITYTPHKAA